MKFKKFTSMLVVSALCVSMTGCSFKDSLRSWLMEDEEKTESVNNDSWTFDSNNNSQEQYSEDVEKAYEFFKDSAEQYEESNKKFVKDENGIGFVETITQDVYDRVRVNKEGLKEFLSDMVYVTKDAKEQLDSANLQADMFYKVVINETNEVKIEIRNGQVTKFDLGNETLEEQIKEELMNGDNGDSATNSNNTIDSNKEEKKVEKPKQETKEEKKVEKPKQESKKEKKEEDTTPKEQKYYCVDCGTEIDKSQYNNHDGRCSSCARTHDKESKPEYICEYCGKAYTLDESDAWEPYDFCSKECSMEWEEKQHEDFENHHSYDENGNMIPCTDDCGDGCDTLE